MDGCRRCDERRKKRKGKKKEEEREEEKGDRHPEPGKAEKDFRGGTTRTMDATCAMNSRYSQSP